MQGGRLQLQPLAGQKQRAMTSLAALHRRAGSQPEGERAIRTKPAVLLWLAVAGVLADAAPAIAQQTTGTPAAPGATTTAGGNYLPPFPPPFTGHIGREAKDSTPDFPTPVRAPKGAPNILLILTDDVGISATSTFGGPVPMPTMDRLAQAGLRYTHSTPRRCARPRGRRCSPDATTIPTRPASSWSWPGVVLATTRSCRRAPVRSRRCSGWQEPQRPRLVIEPGRPLRPVAHLARLRLLLRFCQH
ncbi:hypothetical protein ACVJGD_004468 [Bradyrhizobium sp. USDA 10063]